MTDAYASDSEIQSASLPVDALRRALNEVLFGQRELIELMLCGVISRGHVLLEGLPGLGKTELVKGLSKALNLTTRRVQFTPDLLPGDITGNPVLQEVDGKREFVFQPGPVFTNLLLADEINRASPKTQSALLEAMQERRVTVLGQTHDLPDPFFVLATQNPIELEGTYPLPEAQVDRFLFKLEVLRNSAETLAKIVTHRELGVEPQVASIITRETFAQIQATARRIFLPEIVADYIARVVDATHPGQSQASLGVRFGASPRAALSLAAASKARALMHGRPNASFEDVQALALPVLNHRVLLDYTARMDGKTSAAWCGPAILAEVPVQNLATPRTLKEAAMHLFRLQMVCALLLMSTAAYAQKNIANDELDPLSGTRLQVRSVFDPLPPSGYAPMRIVATNGTNRNAQWGFEFHSQTTNYRKQNQYESSFAVDVPAHTTQSALFMVPMAVGYGDGRNNNGHTLRVEFSGTGFNTPPKFEHDNRSADLPAIALSETLAEFSITQLNKEIESKIRAGGSGYYGGNRVFGSRFEPADLPDSWLGYSGFDFVLLSSTDWQKLKPAVQRALLEWVRLGGRLHVYLTSGTTAASLGLAESKTTSLGQVKTWGWDGKSLPASSTVSRYCERRSV